MAAKDGIELKKKRPLNALAVKNAKPGTVHYDGSHGLQLHVTPAGSARWVQRITIHGKRCDLGLGSADLVTLAEAREAALANRKVARAGGDPRRRTAAKAMTFKIATEEYLKVKLVEFDDPKHKKQWRATLDSYAVPVIGTRPIATIGVNDILRVLQPIWQSKTETATRLRGRIEAVISWAVVHGHRPEGENPARWRGNLDSVLPKPGSI